MLDHSFHLLTFAPITRRVIGLIAAVALLAACGARGETTMINVTTDKAEDRATVIVEDGRALVDVVSPSGIGGLTATLEEGAWPEEVVVRLHLRGLERVEIAYDQFRLETGVSSHGGPDPALVLSVIGEDGSVESASPSADLWYPTITVNGAGEPPAYPLPDGATIDVALPAHFFEEMHPSFAVRWVDFFR